MNSYEIYLQMQYLEQEIQGLQAVMLDLGPDHPDFDHFYDLLWRSENELENLEALDVVEQF